MKKLSAIAVSACVFLGMTSYASAETKYSEKDVHDFVSYVVISSAAVAHECDGYTLNSDNLISLLDGANMDVSDITNREDFESISFTALDMINKYGCAKTVNKLGIAPLLDK